jgi:hypothetical protein
MGEKSRFYFAIVRVAGYWFSVFQWRKTMESELGGAVLIRAGKKDEAMNMSGHSPNCFVV